MSITCKTDGNFGNSSAGVLFSKVVYQRKRYRSNKSLMSWVFLPSIEAHSLAHFSYVNSVEFHPSGTCIAAGGTDSTVKVR